MHTRAPKLGGLVLGGVVWCSAAAAGCVGSIGEGGAPSGDVAPDPNNPLGEDFAPGGATLHTLTQAQLTNSYRALVGEPFDVVLDLPPDDQLYGFTSIAAANGTVSPLAAEKYETAAYAVIDYLWADTARRDAFIGCAPSAVADVCVRDFIVREGRRMWRRPLTDAEIDALVGVGAGVESATGDTWDALRYLVSAMLQSPHFLMRIEVGEQDSERDYLRFTGWEMASRLSFILQDSPPDAALLDAAENGELGTIDGIRSHAARLIDDPKARPALVRFFRDFMNINRLGNIDKSPDEFPMFTATLGTSMQQEIERMFENHVFDTGGDFRKLLTTRETFVNEELAAVYGLSGVTGTDLVPVTLSDDGRRAGLLTTAGFLAMNAHKTATSPTHRGRFVRINLLCQDIPPPPPGVDTSLDPNTGGENQTLRERLEKHREDAACRACHQMMDPIGFAFEHYDPIGAWRDLDNGLPVDAATDVDGTAVDGGVEMADLIAQMPEVAACVARRFYQHANGRLDGKSERPAVDQLAEQFASTDYDFKELVLSLVINDGFRYAAKEAE